jgi:hypothetical protein
MEKLVSSLKAGKASGAEGPDGLAPRFLKNLGEVSRSFMPLYLQQVLEGRGLSTILEGCGNCSHPQVEQTPGLARLLSANCPYILLSQDDGALG